MTDPTRTAYNELLSTLGLSHEDLYRLKNDEVNVMELMTEQLMSIAQKKEVERREYLKNAWDNHQIEIREAEANNTEPPRWYYTEPHDHKFTDDEALEQLACEISESVSAHSELHMAKAYDMGIKDELPYWMTWELLNEWSDIICTKREQARLAASYTPLYPEI
jgi:hypothetical protein